MINSYRSSQASEIKGSTPPKPPEFPIVPREPEPLIASPTPMIYVTESVSFEYRVKRLESIDADRLELELNEMGRDGWQLVHFALDGETRLLIFSRTVEK
jgi:hypothetical protein